MFYKLSKEEIKTKKADDFKEGDIVKVNDYYISIEYGSFNTASMHSNVAKGNPFNIIKMNQWPKYISKFIKGY